MAEWSKAADLRSAIFGCVGSNPTLSNKLALYDCAGPKQHSFLLTAKYLNYNENN